MEKREAQKWFFIEFSLPQNILDENKIEWQVHKILKRSGCIYKYLLSQIVVFDIDNRPEELILNDIEKGIFDYVKATLKHELKENDEDAKEFDSEFFNFNFYEAQELLFSFEISDVSTLQNDFTNVLARIQDGEVVDYDEECAFLESVDYNEKGYSYNPLFHNIRCKNISVFQLKTLSFGFAIIGYMHINNRLRVTIKTFKYQMLKHLIDGIKHNVWFDSIVWESNIKWEWLMSRKIGSGYRTTEEHITKNELMQDFLKKTTVEALASDISQVLDKLLNKGYLNEDEFKRVSSNREISKFLLPYRRLIKNNFPDKGIWIDSSQGLIFNENNKDDPKRIVENTKYESIYAPIQHLLHYIRSFWHQDYVEEIIKHVKKASENDGYVIDYIIDTRFDLLREGQIQKSSRDIDALLSIRNKNNGFEYIIAVEAKRNASEFKSVVKDTKHKIAQLYANIFDGFIVIAYFNDHKGDPFTSIVWGEEEEGMKKPILLCAGTNFNNVAEDVKKAIKQICKMSDMDETRDD